MKAVVTDNSAIKVQGRVEDDIVRRLADNAFVPANNSGWFFIDYSPHDFPLQSKFNLLFNNDTVKANGDIVLKTVIDSFGNQLEEGIPKGFKTVAEFVFHDKIPIELQNLPVLKGWYPTAEEIWLSNIRNIKFDHFSQLADDFYKLILFDLQNEGSDLRQVDKDVLFDYLLKRKITDSEKVLAFFIQQGLIKETNENVLNFQSVD